MKVLFFTAKMQGGGAERVISELANEFARQGHEAVIATTVAPECIYALEKKVRLVDLSKNAPNKLARIRQSRMLLKKERPDAAVSFLTSANIESVLAHLCTGIPVIVSERNDPYRLPESKRVRLLRRLVYPLSEGFVFQTPDAMGFFEKSIRKRSRVIMNPISGTLPLPFDGERTKRIVNVGRLNAQKNQILFLDAFLIFSKDHPDYVAEIYGSGEEEESLRAWITENRMEDRVFLKGFLENVPEAIRDASMFVMSSDYEGMSNALIEAVAMGIPAVSTDHPIGGARLTISDGENGLLVPCRDKTAMAQAMTRIADDAELRRKIAENAPEIRKKFALPVIAREWLDYMNTLQKKETKR